jgi:hypothetical protein
MVVTMVGFSGGGAGGRFAEHRSGCPLVTDELGNFAPDTCLAVWVQPTAPATRITAIAARRDKRNFRVDIGITVLKPGLFTPNEGFPLKARTLDLTDHACPCFR